MANEVEITITADTNNAEAGFGRVKSGFQGMKDSIVKNRKAIGVGITALGVGAEGLAQSQAGLTESTRKLAAVTQFSEDEIRNMASAMSNATFPLESVLSLMELGAQQGLQSADALREYAMFWDTVGDATGLSAVELAKSGAALSAVGIEIGNESELLEAFGLVTLTGTSSVKDFLESIERMAPELSDMGISVDEVAVILTAMEGELGQVGRIARTEFKEALEQSETGLAGVLDQLGLNEEQLGKYRTKLSESGEVMGELSDIHASTKTVMDNFKSSVSDVVFQHGALIEKASLLAPLFMAAGPIVAGFSGIMGIMTPVIHGAKAAFIGLNLSMGPIALIILGIGAVIVAGILIWKNWDKIVNVLKVTFDILKETFMKLWEKFKKHWDKLILLLPVILGPIGLIIAMIVILARNWDTIWAGIQATFETVSEALISTFQNTKTTILGIFESLLGGIKTAVNAIINGINTVIRGINKFKITVPGVSVLGKTIVPEFSMGLPQIPEIPNFAKGGIVNSPTLAMLGEAGPEAVVPLGRGGTTGMTVNLVINGDINGMDDFEQKVTSIIRDAVLGGGFSGVLARA